MNPTEVEYSAAYHYAYPTLTRSPVPDGTGQHGSSARLVTTTAYDFQTGRASSATDANGQTTTFSYADDSGTPDRAGRLRKVTRPDGGWTKYEDGRDSHGDYVRTRTKLNAEGVTSDARQYFDGLGRPSRSFSFDPQEQAAQWLTSDTEYDSMGRAWKVSSPYRSAGPGSGVPSSAKWTEITFDALGRVRQVRTTADDAKVTNDYTGQYATVTDQAGKVRRSKTDALGRLVRVDEPDATSGALDDMNGSPVQSTGYTYDTLGHLRQVSQGTQTRAFVYDSLGRLKTATNPESGTVSYTYDANGNLKTRTDARGVVTTYEYDNLNRNLTVSHATAGTTAAQTPAVERYYDRADAPLTYSRGRLWKTETAGVSRTIVNSFDVAGRPLSQTRQFYAGGAWDSHLFTTAYAYDLAGDATEVTYPSGHKVNYTYDAAGRVATFSGRLGDGSQRTYASDILYHETGGREQEKFGTQTPVYNKALYNGRGQLSEIRVSTYSILAPGHQTDWNRGAIINHYSEASGAWGATDGNPNTPSRNNGNLKKQDIYIPNDDAVTAYSLTTQFYSYDALNRLDLVSKACGGVTGWQQDYDYDRYGNRTINVGGTWVNDPNPPANPIVPEKEFAADANTNRLLVPAGKTGTMSYDNAGNLVYDSYTDFAKGGGRTFDAENRMVAGQFFDGQVRAATYVYDGDGKRVKRDNGLGVVTWQVYGVGGELLGEYAANSSPDAPQKEYGYRAGELLVTADAPINIALGKAATQSSDLAASTPAAKAVDGNTSGDLWGGASSSATQVNSQAWWQVDLGSVNQLSSIKVWARTDCCAEHTSNFYVLVSDVPFTSTDLSTTINQAGVSNYYTQGSAGRPTVVAVNRSGRYVRVQCADNNYLILAEVEVWSAGAAQQAGASSGWSPTNSAPRAWS